MIIIKFKPSRGGNFIRGHVDIAMPKWGGVQIYGITMFEKDDGSRWMQFPAQCFEIDGVKKYKAYMHFENKDMKETFQKKLWELLDEHLKTSVDMLDPNALALGECPF